LKPKCYACAQPGGSALAGRFAPDDVLASYNAELPEVPHAEQVAFGIRDLAWARAFAVRHTSRLGLPSERLEDVALAVGELATNNIRHGGYGLLIVNDLADLVRTHTGPAGTAIRLHFLVPQSSPTAYDGPVEISFDCSRIGRDPLGIRWV
jgi:hypothetical protein